MKKLSLLVVMQFVLLTLFAQTPKTPDQIYGQLFVDVQMNRIFPDNKTFVDCVPKRDPEAIVADYMAAKKNPALRFSLLRFVEENFQIPVSPTSNYKSDTAASVKTHIQQLWSFLKRNPDSPVKGSSLLP